MRSRLVIALPLAISSSTLTLALFLPFCEIRVSTGDSLVDAIAWWAFEADFATKHYSILSGIFLLFEEREYVIAGVILAFSVIFPIVKHAVFWRLIIRRRLTKESLNLLESLGPMSLVDPFVVALSVLAFKRFPAGSISACSGFYVFILSVCTALIASLIARRMHTRGGAASLSICVESVAA
jgi:hypothetical protein